jgi:hypothetical protein
VASGFREGETVVLARAGEAFRVGRRLVGIGLAVAVNGLWIAALGYGIAKLFWLRVALVPAKNRRWISVPISINALAIVKATINNEKYLGREIAMNAYLAAVLAIIALAGAPVGYVFYETALSPDTWVYQGSNQWKNGGVYGAPGPIAGAGLPVAFVVAGSAAYWAARRRRTAN